MERIGASPPTSAFQLHQNDGIVTSPSMTMLHNHMPQINHVVKKLACLQVEYAFGFSLAMLLTKRRVQEENSCCQSYIHPKNHVSLNIPLEEG